VGRNFLTQCHHSSDAEYNSAFGGRSVPKVLLRILPSFGPISISKTIHLISALFVSHVEGTGQLLGGVSCFRIEWCWIRYSRRGSIGWMYRCTCT
jgi:hypothetical protein